MVEDADRVAAVDVVVDLDGESALSSILFSLIVVPGTIY